METRSRTRYLLRGAAVLAALGALTAPATAGAAVKAPVVTKVTPRSVSVGEKLIIRGRNFRVGKGRNRVLFRRNGGKSLFVKADVSTKKRMTVIIPARLENYMPQPGGHPAPAVFRLRVLTKKLSRRFTSVKSSPVVGPRKPKVVAPPVAPPDGDCDGDGIINSVDTDDDNDLLSDATEKAIGTDPCNGDSDGDGVEDGYEVQSAVDLNGTGVPYPGKLPYPNALQKDADVDYDGDGLSLGTEYSLWKYAIAVGHTARTLSPLYYSDGTQRSLGNVADASYQPPQIFAATNPLGALAYDANQDGSASAAELGSWVQSHDGFVSDDERDEDGDGLSNFDEVSGRMTAGWWPACYSTEGAYPVPYAGTSPVDADTDGDGILDGADDQDHDGLTNLQELSRSLAAVGGTHQNQWGSTTCKMATGEQPNALDPQARVNPFNPCLPNASSPTCERHPSFSGAAYAPFDDNGSKYLILN
jgi:hypothetical protein